MDRWLASAVCVLLSGVAEVQAQVHQQWLQTYDATPTGYDQVVATAIAPSGSVYAVGGTGQEPTGGSAGVGTYAALILKYDQAGTLVWSRTIDSAIYINIAVDVVVDPSDESVYIVGRADRDATHGMLALKYDASGTLQWAQTFSPQQVDGQFSRARLAPNGDLIAAGYTGSAISVFEFAPDGRLLWSTLIPGGDYPNDVAVDSFGDVIVAGTITSSGDDTNAVVAKLSPNGAPVWIRTLTGGGSGYEGAAALLTDASGSIYSAGRWIDAAQQPLGVVVKLDSAGNTVWASTSHGTQSGAPYYGESIHALAFAPNGNIRAEGVTDNAVSGRDIHVLEYTPAGSLVWQATWNGPDNGDEDDIKMSTEVDGSMTVLAATALPSGTYEPVAIRWNIDGTLRWASTRFFSSSQRVIVYDAAFGPDGTFAIGGRTAGVMASNALVIKARPQAVPFCFGDGSNGPCPCGNQAAPGEGQGCANSLGAAARLTNSGNASVDTDTLTLTSSGESTNELSVFLQGHAQVAPAAFGDGLMCIAGTLLRLYTHDSSGGSVTAPVGLGASISARSASLGDVISAGSTRYYQVYYRDSAAGFCPPPAGSGFNVSSALSILWVQ